MSVAYEARNFIHEDSYPPMDDEHDHAADQRYDNDVAEQLSHYTTEAGMLAEDRDVMGDDRGMMADGSGVVEDATRLDLSASGYPSPIQVPIQAPHLPDPISEPKISESKDPTPAAESPLSRSKTMGKPDREAVRQPDGKYYCPLPECQEEVRAFTRKCEWK